MVSVKLLAAIPGELIESQLFGHKAGSFSDPPIAITSAFFSKPISARSFSTKSARLTLEGQAKLLRILAAHPFLPVGGTEEITVDVRVIAATNQNLLKYVRDKRFREDLYYRLSVFELYLPPLRDRGDDIGLLDSFLSRPFPPTSWPAKSCHDRGRPQ